MDDRALRWSREWAPTSFLMQLPRECQLSLLRAGRLRLFAANERLLREGDRDSHVLIVLSGFVKTTILVADQDVLMAVRGPGDIIGETAAITGKPRAATVTACGQVHACVVTRSVFERLSTEHREIARRVAAVISDRLQWANRQRAAFAAMSADARLAKALLHIAKLCGRPADNGSVEIGVELSQPELAAMIGVAETTVQKAMRRMREKGLVDFRYRKIRIVRPASLRVASD